MSLSAGGSSGSLPITGLRLSLEGAAVAITVRVSFEKKLNDFLESSTVTVVDSISPGLTAEPMTDTFLVYNEEVIDSSATIPIKEAFVSAFSNSAEFGPDNRNPDSNQGVRLSGGLLMVFQRRSLPPKLRQPDYCRRCSRGIAPRDDTTEVSYVFNQAANSSDTLESFDITFTVSINGSIEILQPTIEVSLGPIGAATPTSELPSTAVPPLRRR